MSAGTDAFLQSWDGLQAYAFPPVAIIPRVLAKIRASTGTELTLVASTLGPAPLLLRPAPAFAGSSSDPAGPSGPLALASVSSSFPDLRRLRLHAWRLSSDLPEPLASPPQ